MPFYYITDIKHEIGAVLTKGRWGTLIRQGHPMSPLEEKLEHSRNSWSPISRMDCFFAFLRVNEVDGYLLKNKKKYVYLVAPINNDYNISIHNYNIISDLRKIASSRLDENSQRIMQYWVDSKSISEIPTLEEQDYAPEVLIDCDVEVVDIL